MPGDWGEGTGCDAAYEHDLKVVYQRGVEDALKRVKELIGRAPYASAHLDNIATEFGVKL